MTEMQFGCSITRVPAADLLSAHSPAAAVFMHSSRMTGSIALRGAIIRAAAQLHSTNQYETFAMDSLGNRDGTQDIRGGETVNYDVNDMTNAYTQVGTFYPAYDNAGNMTKNLSE